MYVGTLLVIGGITVDNTLVGNASKQRKILELKMKTSRIKFEPDTA